MGTLVLTRIYDQICNECSCSSRSFLCSFFFLIQLSFNDIISFGKSHLLTLLLNAFKFLLLFWWNWKWFEKQAGELFGAKFTCLLPGPFSVINLKHARGNKRNWKLKHTLTKHCNNFDDLIIIIRTCCKHIYVNFSLPTASHLLTSLTKLFTSISFGCCSVVRFVGGFVGCCNAVECLR